MDSENAQSGDSDNSVKPDMFTFTPPDFSGSTGSTASPRTAAVRERKSFISFLDRPLLHIRDTKQVLLIGMCGLPARGKTYTATKLARYLEWMGYRCKVWNLGDQRRKNVGTKKMAAFFDPDNTEARQVLNDLATDTLKEIKQHFLSGGQSAIYDAANVTQEARDQIRKFVSTIPNAELLWVELVCNIDSVVEDNISATKTSSPDYQGMEPAEAVKDFSNRIEHYRKYYHTIEDSELTLNEGYIKLIDTGKKTVTNNIAGYLPGRLVFFLSNLQMTNKTPIYFSRHGQSEYNAKKLLGGDSGLTAAGAEYAGLLAKWLYKEESLNAHPKNLAVWCSTLKRTIQTASVVYRDLERVDQVVKWRALTEINAGVFDGMTYEEVKALDPEGYANRAKDKLNYKYPQGESYKDVIDRVERIIFEIERTNRPVLVVGHQAVLRCLYGYFMHCDIQKIPHLPIPLHTVLKLQPTAYGCVEERYELSPLETPSHHKVGSFEDESSGCPLY